nr:MFS transporter [uncultured Cohaesibacter sp.]
MSGFQDMTTKDVFNTIMIGFAKSHRKPEVFALDLAIAESGLNRHDVIKRGHTVSTTRQQRDSRLPFILSSTISLLVLATMLTVVKSRPPFHSDKKARIGFVFKHAKLILLSAVVGGFCFFGLPSFLTIYGIKNGLKTEDAALLLTMFMLGSVTLGMAVSSLSAFFNHYRLVFICVCTSVFCASFLSLAIYSHLLVALGLLYLWGGCMGGIYALGLNIIGEQFRQEDQMSANMTYTLMDAIGGMIGLCVIGTSMDFIGAEGLSYTIVVAAMCYLVYFFRSIASRFSVVRHLVDPAGNADQGRESYEHA